MYNEMRTLQKVSRVWKLSLQHLLQVLTFFIIDKTHAKTIKGRSRENLSTVEISSFFARS